MELLKSDFLGGADILFVIFSTILCVLFILAPLLNENTVRIVLSFLLVFFTCGYSFTAALFPRKDDLDGIERVTLSFGLSIVIVPLLGLILNYTPFGIRLIPMLIALSVFTISFSLFAWIRRMKLSPEERFSVPFEKLLKTNLGQSVLDKVLSILLIASIVIACIALVYVAVTPKTGEKFTEFYILGPNRMASSYPTDIEVGEEGKVIIGVVNHEYENVTYRIVVRFDNDTIAIIDNIKLTHGEKWELNFIFKPEKIGENIKLEFILYREGLDEPYRILHLWITVSGRK
jgi:uncharacterized membrane protein